MSAQPITPPRGSATGLYDAAAELLRVAAVALEATPNGAPSRQYVSCGAPAADCDQLTVHAIGPALRGIPSQEPADVLQVRYPRWYDVGLVITIWRCAEQVSEMDPPTPADLDAVAQVTYMDAWVVFNTLRWRHLDGTLLAGYARPLGVTIGSAITAGGLAGWQIPLSIQLNGFDPDG